MSNNKSAKSNRINIKNPVYALITSDDKSGIEYGPVKPFGEAMQIQITPEVSKGELYGNGVKTENIAMLTGITVAFDANKIYIETRAEILGNTYQDGVAIENAEDQPVDIAFGYEVEQTGKSSEYVWLLKGKAEPLNQTIKQKEGNINFSTDSITMNFVPRIFDNNLKYFADSANADFTKAQADAWFKSGPKTFPAPQSET